MNRRDFLWLTGIATGSVSVSSLLAGCAIDPVTGSPTFSLVSEQQEKDVDIQQSPHQFSADYGPTSDDALNQYVSTVGSSVAAVSHRPNMPYNFRVLDANHVNAYTFPAGSMAVTRGIMVELNSESELAALLGHEIGHVNARHSAERSTKGLLAQAAVGVAGSAVNNAQLQQLITGVGMVSATALLAKYSRDNEREADRLGMDYSVASGANPKGMVDLMNMLNSLHDSRPGAMDIMFSSHPMSDERLANVNSQLSASYTSQTSRNMGTERYMDVTSALRSQKPFIKHLANADLAISAGKFDAASSELNQAGALNEEDFAYWVIRAKHEMAVNKPNNALNALRNAEAIKPEGYLALYMKGVNYLEITQPEAALLAFQRYKTLLPGNPMIDFFIGYSHEMNSQQPQAAAAYKTYLTQVQSGPQAEYAYKKLIEWGYVS